MLGDFMLNNAKLSAAYFYPVLDLQEGDFWHAAYSLSIKYLLPFTLCQCRVFKVHLYVYKSKNFIFTLESIFDIWNVRVIISEPASMETHFTERGPYSDVEFGTGQYRTMSYESNGNIDGIMLKMHVHHIWWFSSHNGYQIR